MFNFIFFNYRGCWINSNYSDCITNIESMNKLQKLAKGMVALAKQPSLINAVLDHQDVRKNDVSKEYNLPHGFPQIDIRNIIQEETVTISPFSFLDGSSIPTDFVLLKSLAKRNEVQDYFEIGTWRGASVANIAQIVPNCYTLNLSDSQLKEMGQEDNYIKSHRFFSKDLKNVEHLFGDSKEFDFKKLDKKFDLIFIDGDHHYEGVKKDTETAFKLLKDKNSVIVWHDYAFSPERVRWEVMKGILDGTPAEKRKNLYHVSNTMCAFYTEEVFPTRDAIPNTLPDKSFSLDIKVNNL